MSLLLLHKRRIINNVSALQADIDLTALFLLAAFSPRAAARRLRKIGKRLDNIILDVIDLPIAASIVAEPLVVAKPITNGGNGNAEASAQSALAL